MLSITKAYYRGYQAVMRAVIKIANIKEPELVCGPGSLEKLPGILKEAGIERILVVASHSMMKSGGLGGFFKRLEADGISSSVYDRVQPNPSIDNIEDCLKAYNEGGSGAIVAIGGGSPIDCAKVVAARVACPGRPIRALRGYLKVRGRLPPLYAVPTTAGSGSEATIAAVVTDSATHEKYAITDFKLVPGFAVLDPVLTVGLPAPTTAATGMELSRWRYLSPMAKSSISRFSLIMKTKSSLRPSLLSSRTSSSETTVSTSTRSPARP